MGTLNIDQIKNYLPHRYPFLLIDRVTDYVEGQSLTAVKNVTINEPFFQGHFPVKPVMPGVLIIEAMAQAAALLGCVSLPGERLANCLYYLAGVDNVRFKRPVEPGDQLIISIDFEKERRNLWKFNARASVDEHFIASATLLTTVVTLES